MREAGRLGVSMLTVHASGGSKMLRAATEAAATVNSQLMVLAVTVLTSLGDQDLDKLGIQGAVQDQVTRLAALALANGCHGIVASAREAGELRAKFDKEFAIVTPGVRPAGAAHGDQARVLTPAEAMASGATYIVVGRPITEAEDPAEEARAILGQITLDSHSAVTLSLSVCSTNASCLKRVSSSRRRSPAKLAPASRGPSYCLWSCSSQPTSLCLESSLHLR